MTLHILNTFDSHGETTQRLLKSINPQNDAILLLEDGVYNAQARYIQPFIDICPAIFAISDDIEARGINNMFNTAVTLANYEDFVRLTVEHDKSISWF